MVSPADTPVVILAGGRGARFDHESQVLPKPLIRVAGKPIIEHIIDSFREQGFRTFKVAAGYLIHEFLDGTNALDWAGDGEWYYHGLRFGGWQFSNLTDGSEVTIVDTGVDSHTGERVWRLREHIDGRRFVLTYGDGLSDVLMSDVLEEHERDYTKLSWCQYQDGTVADHPAHAPPIVTLTAVNPPGRFGVLGFNGAYHRHVRRFQEKTSDEWINGGFMVCEPELLDLIVDAGHDRPTFWQLESQVLPSIADGWRLRAYRHHGYWACMDTRRDLEKIEADVVSAGRLPWRRVP